VLCVPLPLLPPVSHVSVTHPHSRSQLPHLRHLPDHSVGPVAQRPGAPAQGQAAPHAPEAPVPVDDPLLPARALLYVPSTSLLRSGPGGAELTKRVRADYLAGKGIFKVAPQRIGQIAVWSCRFWAAYVVLCVTSVTPFAPRALPDPALAPPLPPLPPPAGRSSTSAARSSSCASRAAPSSARRASASARATRRPRSSRTRMRSSPRSSSRRRPSSATAGSKRGTCPSPLTGTSLFSPSLGTCRERAALTSSRPHARAGPSPAGSSPTTPGSACAARSLRSPSSRACGWRRRDRFLAGERPSYSSSRALLVQLQTRSFRSSSLSCTEKC